MSIEVLIHKLAPKDGTPFAYELEQAMLAGGVHENLEKDMFIATLLHECNWFEDLEENLNYSANRLLQVFPKYFGAANVKEYAGKPEKIANRVYANRMGNGPEESGDGYKHRGMGLIQLTGKNNHRLYSLYQYNDERVLVYPEVLTRPFDAARAAVWFWNINKCGIYARRGDFQATQSIVNTGRANAPITGINGYADRLKKLQIVRAKRRELEV